MQLKKSFCIGQRYCILKGKLVQEPKAIYTKNTNYSFCGFSHLKLPFRLVTSHEGFFHVCRDVWILAKCFFLSSSFFLANIYSWAWKSVWVEKMFFLFCITFHKSSLNIFHHSTPIYVTMGIYANVPEGIVHEIFGRKLFFIPSFHVFLLNCISTEIAQWEIEWRNKNSKLFFQKNYIC